MLSDFTAFTSPELRLWLLPLSDSGPKPSGLIIAANNNIYATFIFIVVGINLSKLMYYLLNRCDEYKIGQIKPIKTEKSTIRKSGNKLKFINIIKTNFLSILIKWQPLSPSARTNMNHTSFC